MKRTDASGHAANMFQDSSAPTTQVDASWLNAVQEEIAAVIEDEEGGDAVLNAADNTQLLAAIQTMISNALATTAGRKMGRWTGYIAAGQVIYVAFPVAFPGGTNYVLALTALNSSSSSGRDNFIQRGPSSEAGFYAVVQGTVTGGDNTLDGFDWIAEALPA